MLVELVIAFYRNDRLVLGVALATPVVVRLMEEFLSLLPSSTSPSSSTSMERSLGMFNFWPAPKLIFLAVRGAFRPCTGGDLSDSSSIPDEAGFGALESFTGRYFLGLCSFGPACLLRLAAISWAYDRVDLAS